MEEKTNLTIKSVTELQKEFDKVFLLADRGIIPLLCATVLSNQIDDIKPIWLLIISPPSSGKSELIEMLEFVNLNGKPIAFPISDLTVNTFASGQQRPGKETSLLHKMKNGSIMTFKDFTSMISKNDDAQKAIMAQLREIYDQNYVKRTGTGEDIEWKGKVGAIAGCTQAIYESNEQFSVMGDRFIMYQMVQPERMAVLKHVMKNKKDKTTKFSDKIRGLKGYMKSYLEYCIDNIENVPLELSEESENDLLEVVNFVTMIASGVFVDKYKGTISFVPDPTMPMRMAHQILGLAQSFILMNKLTPGNGVMSPVGEGDLTPDQIKILYKVAFDTIPIKRRMALKVLATFTLGVSTAGLATKIGYQTPVVAGWLAQLNALGICERDKTSSGIGDKWLLRDQYRDIMVRFDHIKTVHESLDDADEKAEYVASWAGENSREYDMAPLGQKDDFQISDEEAKVNDLFNL